jgi:hypothetical protein
MESIDSLLPAPSSNDNLNACIAQKHPTDAAIVQCFVARSMFLDCASIIPRLYLATSCHP